MTSETMRHLLKKLPTPILIECLIQVYETTFSDPKELMAAYHPVVLMIQAREVYLERAKLESFSEPFRTEIEEYLTSITKG